MDGMDGQKSALYGLMVAEVARITVGHCPLDDNGDVIDARQRRVRRWDRKGDVFYHGHMSAYEQACFMLWALEVVAPVQLIGGRWEKSVGKFEAYFQLLHDIEVTDLVVAGEATRSFPSIDYVLSTYSDVLRQSLYPAATLMTVLRDNDPILLAELQEDLEASLPAGYDSEQSQVGMVIERTAPQIARLLELSGYLIRDRGRLSWTKLAEPALRGDSYTLQNGDVGIVDGLPRLLKPPSAP